MFDAISHVATAEGMTVAAYRSAEAYGVVSFHIHHDRCRTIAKLHDDDYQTVRRTVSGQYYCKARNAMRARYTDESE